MRCLFDKTSAVVRRGANEKLDQTPDRDKTYTYVCIYRSDKSYRLFVYRLFDYVCACVCVCVCVFGCLARKCCKSTIISMKILRSAFKLTFRTSFYRERSVSRDFTDTCQTLSNLVEQNMAISTLPFRSLGTILFLTFNNYRL